MPIQRFVASAVVAAMCLGPVNRATADNNGVAAGLAAIAIIGIAAANANKNNGASTTRRNTPEQRAVPRNSSGNWSAVRAANRETQTALNYFGYNAGTVDGQLGRRSRAAISGMQAYMGLPVTGEMTPFEREILIGAYTRGSSGNHDALQIINNHPDGVRALLKAQRDILTGGPGVMHEKSTGYAGLPT